MKAIGYLNSLAIDQADALVDFDQAKPSPTGRDLLVKIHAVSVNPVDTKVRMRVQPENNEHKVLGWDAVGEVVEVGDQVCFYKKGDTVWYAGDLTRPGTNAEYHLVDERIVGEKPRSLSDAQAAAFPLTAITAWELLFDRLQIAQTNPTDKTDQQILVIGAAGGVGSILVQLATQLTNSLVIGTASRPESQAWVKELGADHVIDHRKPLSQELKRIGIPSVSHVISLNATEQHFPEIAEVIAPQGKFALIDDPSTPLDIGLLKTKSASVHWEFMYTRSMYNTADIEKQRELLNRVATLIDHGDIKTTFGAHYGTINAANLKRAHADIESGKTIGKIVLEGFDH
ncbi:zinc-binding alcohol dehydrogenase family protein [Aestuariirhabdus sp. Z084]|uniref:zinc-binding alcohol dehydrogenase family protein n=1 Tax=Aestuariirhabdus haliotis TaxID=2918751 RepID=UPI00201B3E0E|nr:zinc-binding alcohol dehydrogenase family protein [Aestuariirhabdus haliotis]MCL6415017.1 zinc-binding alcohol dehydrogenase family protein [Aestuariirhabdus haliotis]MCL6418949.1 zinc-binding alcohol dehydrogenase family protein [Aestuariirhabdus haliotis]